MRAPCLIILAAASACLAEAAAAQCFDEVSYLTESGDPYLRCNGQGVAADGPLAVVGNPCGEDVYPYLGYATVWSLDPSTGEWLQGAHLSPDDGTIDGPNSFGASVAISGTTVVVSASSGSHPEGTGAAYVYEENGGGGWYQAAKLTAEFPMRGDTFGWSIAIDGDWILASAPGDDGQDSNAGAAFFFRRVGGSWVRTQRVEGSSFGSGWLYGWSADIDGDTAVIGAPKNGSRAFVYRLDDGVWVEEAVLTGFGAGPGDEFGNSVAVSGDTIVASAPYDDDGGSNTGAAYVFDRDPDTGEWAQTAKIVWPGAADDARLGYSRIGGRGVAIEGDRLVLAVQNMDAAVSYERSDGEWSEAPGTGIGGDAVAVRGGTMISGHRDAGSGGVAAVATCEADGDLDGDGLLDSWESEGGGIDVNGDGTIDLDLYALGARPDRRDLFIEIDIMDGGSFSQEGLDTVVESFLFSPVENPDGTTGIELHAMVDELDIPSAPQWDKAFHDFDNVKAFYFGTPQERVDPNAEHILNAKRRAFRYCVLVQTIAEGTLGIAERPGNDMYLGMAGLSSGNVTSLRPFEWWFAHVFMHELGHTLGLTHGGSFDTDGDGNQKSVNYKPNYMSVMNYNFDTVSIEASSGDLVAPLITFSWEAQPPLDESNLDETIGVTSPSLFYENYWVMFTANEADGSMSRDWLRIGAVGDASADYNGDGDTEDTGVAADLNQDWAGDSPGEVMGGFNDWANLEYAIGEGGNWDDYVHEPLEEPELSDELATEHRERTPPPPVGCRVDTNHDGVVDTRDVLAYLNLFSNGRGAADFNLDGVVDTRDVLAYLNDWVAGCP